MVGFSACESQFTAPLCLLYVFLDQSQPFYAKKKLQCEWSQCSSFNLFLNWCRQYESLVTLPATLISKVIKVLLKLR